MNYPLESTQFSARLINDDLELINSMLPELVPDKNLEDGISGREIMMSAFEKAASKLKKEPKSDPKDQEEIKRLEERVLELVGLLEDKSEEYQNLKNENEKLFEQKLELDKSFTELERLYDAGIQEKSSLEKFKPVENEMRVILSPFTGKVLQFYSRLVTRSRGKEMTPPTILVDLFERYVTKKEIELPGFPLIPDVKLKEIKDSING